MTSEKQNAQKNTNGSRMVDTVVETVQSKITETAQTAKVEVEQRVRQKADEVSVEVQDQTRTTVQRLREWFNASNRRNLAINRKGRSFVRLPLTAALLIVAAGLIISAPVVLIVFGVGVALGVGLSIEDNPGKPKRK